MEKHHRILHTRISSLCSIFQLQQTIFIRETKKNVQICPKKNRSGQK